MQELGEVTYKWLTCCFTTAYSSCECVIICIFLRVTFHILGYFSFWLWCCHFRHWSNQTRLQTPYDCLGEGTVQVGIHKLKGGCHFIQEFMLSVMLVQSVLVTLHHSFWKIEFRRKSLTFGCGFRKQVLLGDNPCCDDFIEPRDAGLLIITNQNIKMYL